jgi:hypothetical protein
MRRHVVLIAALLFVSSSLFAQSAGAMHKRLTAESTRLAVWASDKILVDAVKAQNAKAVALADIQKIDEEWRAGKVRGELMKNACADRLRQLANGRSYYVEMFVMDNQGALVCANEPTSDYWQGDEAKWMRAFNEGKGSVFIDRPRYDESAKANLGQISLPVKDGATVVGVITVGVITDRLPKAP